MERTNFHLVTLMAEPIVILQRFWVYYLLLQRHFSKLLLPFWVTVWWQTDGYIAVLLVTNTTKALLKFYNLKSIILTEIKNNTRSYEILILSNWVDITYIIKAENIKEDFLSSFQDLLKSFPFIYNWNNRKGMKGSPKSLLFDMSSSFNWFSRTV